VHNKLGVLLVQKLNKGNIPVLIGFDVRYMYFPEPVKKSNALSAVFCDYRGYGVYGYDPEILATRVVAFFQDGTCLAKKVFAEMRSELYAEKFYGIKARILKCLTSVLENGIVDFK
jgi:hypothetical protein